MSEILPNKEESVNLDINFDSISEINLKNTSFYSVNDPLPNDSRITPNEMLKSKSEKKMDLESVKMLPYYIEKVSQNIKFIDQIINKNNVSGRSQSKDKNTNNTSGSLSHKDDVNSVTNIQNIVKKSVEGVHEVLNNKKLNTTSLNNSHGSIGKNYEKDSRENSSREIKDRRQESKERDKEINFLTTNLNKENHTSGVTSHSSNTLSVKENLTSNQMNVSQNLSSKNLKIIEERDEDLFSRNSNMLYEPVKKKNLTNLNKANFVGVTKKITINNLTSSERNGVSPPTNIKHANSITPPLTNSSIQNKNKISTVSTTKKNITPIGVTNTTSANKKKTNPLSISTPTSLVPNKKNKITSISNIKPNTTITNSTPMNKGLVIEKKKKPNNISHVVQPSPSEVIQSSHKKTSSITYTTEPNLTTSTKSNHKIATPTPSVKDKSLTNKKSTGNLTSMMSFNSRKKNLSVDSDGCCCKCHINRKTSLHFQGSQSVRKSSLMESALNTHRSSAFNINKLNDLHDVNVKSITELFYIFNDINSINHSNREKRQSLISPNQSFMNINSKCNFNELLSTLKNFIHKDEEERHCLETENNLENLNPANDLYNENISAKIIQRKWRENKIKKLMYPLMALDTTHNKLEKFSFFNCNKKEILKLSKVHLYTTLLRSSEKFKNVLSLMNQAAFAWQELMKNNSKIFFLFLINFLDVFSTAENLIKEMTTLDDINFISAMSKIISNDIKINSSYTKESEKEREKEMISNINQMFDTSLINNQLTRNATMGCDLPIRNYSTLK
jgi:hypothetical protein